MVLSTTNNMLDKIFGCEKSIEIIAKAGFDAVDLSLCSMGEKNNVFCSNDYLDYAVKLLELAKKLPEGLGVGIEVRDNIYKISIVNNLLLELYSFSSTNPIEVFNRVNSYIDTLDDWDKFEEFYSDIKNNKLEVGV